MKPRYVTLIGTLAALCLAQILFTPAVRADERPAVVTDFELERYTGLWYEIARYENFFQKGLDLVTAEYRPEDGKIKVINQGIKPNGKTKTSTAKLRQAGDPDEGLMEVQFVWPLWVDYRVIALCDDYQVALTTSESDKYFWLLSRTPNMSEAELETWLTRAEALGFARDKMVFRSGVPTAPQADPSTEAVVAVDESSP